MPKKKAQGRSNGQGTIYKHRDKFRWQFSLPGRDGRPTLRLGGVEPTREAAELKLIEVRLQHSKGTLSLSQHITFDEYSRNFMKRSRGWSESTQRRYEVLAQYCRDYFGTKPMRDILPRDILAFMQALSERKSVSSRNKGQSLSPRTMKTVSWLLRSIFSEAVTEGFVNVNPCIGIKSPKQSRLEREAMIVSIKALDIPEAERLVAIGTLLYKYNLCYHWPAIYTMLSLGLRRGEAAALKWENVDFQGKVIHIRGSLNTKQTITPPKTTSSRRSIPMPASVEAILRTLPQKSETVFCSVASKYVDPNLFNRTLSNLIRWSNPEKLDENLKKAAYHEVYPGEDLITLIRSGASLPSINIHGLRHTYATLSLRRGVPVEIVSKTLGHGKISVTYDIYRHVLDAEWREKVIDLFA